jgi:uncharacterized protein (DUF1330 family)
MKTVKPTEQQLGAFISGAHDGKPVAMLNMLKFRAESEYPEEYLKDHPEHANRTGLQAYEYYSSQTTPFLFSVGGQLLWMGNATVSLIGPEDEHWDRVFLVYYPSRDALKKMLAMPAYQAVMVHRDAALEDSRLLETKKVAIPRVALMAMRLFYRVKSLF